MHPLLEIWGEGGSNPPSGTWGRKRLRTSHQLYTGCCLTSNWSGSIPDSPTNWVLFYTNLSRGSFMRTMYIAYYEEDYSPYDNYTGRLFQYDAIPVEIPDHIKSHEDFLDFIKKAPLHVHKWNENLVFRDKPFGIDENVDDIVDNMLENEYVWFPPHWKIRQQENETRYQESVTGKKRVYVFVRTDISVPQQAVQAAHAAYQAGCLFLKPEDIPSLILLGVDNKEALVETSKYLDKNNIKYYLFEEPHYNMGYSAIGTECLLAKDWGLFQSYSLWEPGII